MMGFLTGSARSSVSFPHHPQAQRWWRVRGKSRFWFPFQGWWGSRWCVTCPPDSWPLCSKCPARQGRKPYEPFALDWSAGLNWSAESYLAARWSSSLIVPAFSSTPTSLLRSHRLVKKEYSIACSKENLLIRSRLDYLTCFHFAFIKKKEIHKDWRADDI